MHRPDKGTLGHLGADCNRSFFRRHPIYHNPSSYLAANRVANPSNLLDGNPRYKPISVGWYLNDLRAPRTWDLRKSMLKADQQRPQRGDPLKDHKLEVRISMTSEYMQYNSRTMHVRPLLYIAIHLALILPSWPASHFQSRFLCPYSHFQYSCKARPC